MNDLTKLEWFTGQILAGTDFNKWPTDKELAEYAVELAKAVIEELDKEQNGAHQTKNGEGQDE
jgi:hypothetical protein